MKVLKVYDRRTHELLREENSEEFLTWIMRAENCDRKTAEIIAEGFPSGHVVMASRTTVSIVGISRL